MQYPIIDNLMPAYRYNSWTGLDNKNLLNEIEQGTVGETKPIGSEYENMKLNGYSNRCRSAFLIPVDTTISLSSSENSGFQFALLQFDENKKYLGSQTFIGWTSFPSTKTLNINCKYIGIIFKRSNNSAVNPSDLYAAEIQIENGNSVSDYESPANIYNEISYRLKVPIIKYFPHPVIDALQRAAAGTQTADDTEILQHYLTPLGIGGI